MLEFEIYAYLSCCSQLYLRSTTNFGSRKHNFVFLAPFCNVIVRFMHAMPGGLPFQCDREICGSHQNKFQVCFFFFLRGLDRDEIILVNLIIIFLFLFVK